MALADWDAYLSAVAFPTQNVSLTSAYNLSPSDQFPLVTTYHQPKFPGNPDELTATSTAEALDSTSPGAIPLPYPGNTGRLVCLKASTSPQRLADSDFGKWWLVDRLSHQGGLAGNIDTSQTTNLPTAALTRYTDGVGVMAAIYVNPNGGVGATDSTATISYTNQAGTAGRTGTTSWADTPSEGKMMLFGLEGTDTGVRSVESFQLSVSTGSAGNLGIVLFKPLCFLNVPGSVPVGFGTEIDADACLEALIMPGVDYTTSREHTLALSIVEV